MYLPFRDISIMPADLLFVKSRMLHETNLVCNLACCHKNRNNQGVFGGPCRGAVRAQTDTERERERERETERESERASKPASETVSEPESDKRLARSYHSILQHLKASSMRPLQP